MSILDMSILTPVAAVLSVFVAYYFGQKSRTTPLRSAAYSKQMDLALEVSQQLNDWDRQMHDIHRKVDLMEPVDSREEKENLLKLQAKGMRMVEEALRTVQHCELLLPSRVVDELSDAVGPLLQRSIKTLDLAYKKATPTPPDREIPDDEVKGSSLDDLQSDFSEAMKGYREACRDEFGIEALSDETQQAVEQLEADLLPQFRSEGESSN